MRLIVQLFPQKKGEDLNSGIVVSVLVKNSIIQFDWSLDGVLNKI